ncbi:hypothetical protein OIV83_000300 [Microbotryomycetes sp. JL201]|nr:hypothetical protein OIV83_000300 [Microbotryomycetes sp. JL201]
MGLWSRTYVCCAVPLYNVGAYAILSQFTVIALVTGVLCFAAPDIIAVTVPSFAPYILGIVCMAVAVFQLFGFLGVYRDKPSMFKTYARINTVLVTAALVIALALIIISAARHSTAVNNCVNLFADRQTSTDQVTSGTDICNVWTWVQIGIMGLLFVIVALCEAYFLMFSHIYSSEQKLDHKDLHFMRLSARYNSVYSTAAEEIRQSGLWESMNRPSLDAPGYPQTHARQQSGLRNEVSRYDDELYDDAPPAAVAGGQRYMDDSSDREKGYGQPYVGVYPGEERFDPPVAHYSDPYSHNDYYSASDAYHRHETPHPVEVQQAAQLRGYAPQGQAWDPAYRR